MLLICDPSIVFICGNVSNFLDKKKMTKKLLFLVSPVNSKPVNLFMNFYILKFSGG